VTAVSGASDGPAAAVPGPSAAVLADRIAAALVHHEPGWRLPRQSALARRYNVSPAEVDAAIGELSMRHLIRRLPDGQLYRASPAEYLISLEGAAGLASHIDPMGGEISCRSRHVSWRRVPEDIGWSLGVPPGEPACVVRLLWTAGGEPAALATAYLARHIAGEPTGSDTVPPASLAMLPLLAQTAAGRDGGQGTARPGPGDAAGQAPPAWLPRALFVEMQPPPPAVARSLRLSAGQPAAMLTVRFEDPGNGRPAALTVAVLRPDLFRIVVESPVGASTSGTAGSLSGAWTHALRDWEP
jgi:DNA-binding GntR family transcriptional regulator